MRNRRSAKIFLDHCIEQRRTLPEISQLDTNNFKELDEMIDLVHNYLEFGKIHTMDSYVEPITNSVALWLLELNTTYDNLLEELEIDSRN